MSFKSFDIVEPYKLSWKDLCKCDAIKEMTTVNNIRSRFATIEILIDTLGNLQQEVLKHVNSYDYNINPVKYVNELEKLINSDPTKSSEDFVSEMTIQVLRAYQKFMFEEN